MKTQKQNKPQLSAEMEFHIREWKYWSDEILDQVQRFYESECGYNGECGHVWVDVEGDRLKLPAIENKFKYALVVAGTKRKALATALEEQRLEYQGQINHKNKTIEQMMGEIRYLRSSQPERRKPIIRIKNGDTWYIPMITQAHDTPDGLYIEAELGILNGKGE